MHPIALAALSQRHPRVLVTTIAPAAGGGGGTGTYDIAWSPDGFYADGVALSGARVGFNIYGSTTRGDLNPGLLLTVANPNAVGATITGLLPGDWYFSVTSYTSTAESDPVTYLKVTIA